MNEGNYYQLRWFTPGGEIDLCGHATLATAYVIMHFVEPDKNQIQFETLSGRLTVKRKGEFFEMVFPSYELKVVEITDDMIDAMGAIPVEEYMGRDLLCIMESEEAVRNMNPDQNKILVLPGLLLQVTAKGTEFDCVSRSFAPKCNVPDDPVCGSGHCHILLFWSEKLGKNELTAYHRY